MQDERKTKKQLVEELQALRRAVVALRVSNMGKRSDSEERYRAVVDNVLDGIITIDDRGTIASFNRAAEHIFGYSSEDVLGHNVSVLMPEPYHGEHDTYLHNYLSTGEKKIIGIGREVTGRRRNGSTFPMDLAVSEFRLGERRMFTGIVRDITERKQLEAQLLQSQKIESVGQLAGGIAHDFNNQLGIILFDVDMLLDTRKEDAQLHEDLLKIRRVVLRASNLTRQLLLFSRRQQLEPKPTDLNLQVRELRKMLDRLLGEPIDVALDLEEGLWIINADPGNIDQVVLNLAINSRDAMPEGGTLRFSTDNMLIDETHVRRHTQARQGRFVRLQVEDTGTGMEEQVLGRIFEPFFTTKEVGKGTGLGLSVVYGIVQAHEGWIEVDSAPGRGSCFSIYIPALEEDRDSRAPERRATGRRDGRGLGERILLVEDETELGERTARVLADKGYQVSSCCTAAEARQIFHREEGRFDLVVSDVVLPDGRGPELVFQFLDARPGLCALLVTGYIDEHLDWERVHRQQIPVLQKPYAVADLLEQVRAALA